MTLDIPITLTSSVYHVGTLEPQLRGRHHSTSLEGHCLSVSHCPASWTRIARLGGQPCHLLRKADGTPAAFLDMISAAQHPEIVQEATAWASALGLCESKSQWKAWSTDEEGALRYALCDSLEDAQLEMSEHAEDDLPEPEAVTTLVCTEAMATYLGCRLHKGAGLDLIIAAWADQALPALDGVWWHEELAPNQYSAPRGGIFPSRLTQWQSSAAHLSDSLEDSDDIELASTRALMRMTIASDSHDTSDTPPTANAPS